METLYRKGDILTAIDPCIMKDSKDQALILGKEYVIFKSTRDTIWINSEIGEHQFKIKGLSEFFDETIKSDSPKTQIQKLKADKAELLEALEKIKNEMIQCLKFLRAEGYEYMEFENLSEVIYTIQKHK